MGGNGRDERQLRRRTGRITTALAVLFAVAACDDGGAVPQPTTPAGDPVVSQIGPGDAITALVRWHAAETGPVVDDAGDEILPVVYVASDSGDTIDVGLQATVVEQTVDDAVVRFADDRSEAIDTEADGAPVKDDGVLMLVGEMPEPGRSVSFPVTVYRAEDDERTIDVEVSATDAGVDVTATPTTTPS